MEISWDLWELLLLYIFWLLLQSEALFISFGLKSKWWVWLLLFCSSPSEALLLLGSLSVCTVPNTKNLSRGCIKSVDMPTKRSKWLVWYLSVMAFPRFSQRFKISMFYVESWEKSFCAEILWKFLGTLSWWETRYNFRQLWLSELYVVLASKPEEWVMMLLFFLQMWIGYSLSIWIFRYCI